MKLGDHIKAATKMPDADFWMVRRSSEDQVGRPVKEYNPEYIGIKVTSDSIDPAYLFYLMQHLWMNKVFARLSSGTTRLVNIKVSDVTGIPIQLTK